MSLKEIPHKMSSLHIHAPFPQVCVDYINILCWAFVHWICSVLLYGFAFREYMSGLHTEIMWQGQAKLTFQKNGGRGDYPCPPPQEMFVLDCRISLLLVVLSGCHIQGERGDIPLSIAGYWNNSWPFFSNTFWLLFSFPPLLQNPVWHPDSEISFA